MVFVNVAAQLKGPAEKSDFKHITEHVNSKVPSDASFNIPEINSSFVRIFLKSLDVTKATGLDCIGPKILKIAPDVLCPSLSYIINKSLESGIFPHPWKEAKISPIFKCGSKDGVTNYRPISILPTLSKIIEKWIHKHLMSFLKNHNLLVQFTKKRDWGGMNQELKVLYNLQKKNGMGRNEPRIEGIVFTKNGMWWGK